MSSNGAGTPRRGPMGRGMAAGGFRFGSSVCKAVNDDIHQGEISERWTDTERNHRNTADPGKELRVYHSAEWYGTLCG